MDKHIREKRRKGLCEEIGCYNKATRWIKFGFSGKRYICEACFKEMDGIYKVIAKAMGWRYESGSKEGGEL
jgi:hypothetical protein